MATSGENFARIRNLVAAFNRHDVPACAAHLSATATLSRGDGLSLEGRDALAARLQDFLIAFPDARLTPFQMLTPRSDVAVVEWTLEATHLGALRLPGRSEPIPPTGRAVRFVGANLIGFNAAGEIEWNEARIDNATLLTQIGISPAPSPNSTEIRELAERYTAAWCSGDAPSVAAFYAENGSLSVNGGAPAAGREAITAVAQGFMTAFPDMEVFLDDLLVQDDRAIYRWTLTGTNSGPGGTGHEVRISGFEVWQIGKDGLIAHSRGYFDSAAYLRQLELGAKEVRDRGSMREEGR